MVSLRSRDLQRARSVADMYASVSSCWKKSKIRLIRAASSTACCRFRRCVLVRVRIEFANRAAPSASEDRIATRLSRSILTSEFRRASRSRTMFTCSRVPKNADFDLRPLYLMDTTKYPSCHEPALLILTQPHRPMSVFAQSFVQKQTSDDVV